MAYYYFQVEGEAAKLELDNDAIDVSLPSISRTYEQIRLFNNNTRVRGVGAIQQNEIVFSRKFRKNGTGTAWNTLRYNIMKWLGLPSYKKLYFYIVDSDGLILRAKVFPSKKGAEKYTNLAISDVVSFSFIVENGFFENQTATTFSKTLSGTAQELLTVTNNGLMDVPPIITFTAGANFSLFQVELSDGYGFRLSSSFTTGQEIVYNCKNAKAYIDGNETTGILSAGSIFNLALGDNILYIYATSGTIDVSFNERYI